MTEELKRKAACLFKRYYCSIEAAFQCLTNVYLMTRLVQLLNYWFRRPTLWVRYPSFLNICVNYRYLLRIWVFLRVIFMCVHKILVSYNRGTVFPKIILTLRWMIFSCFIKAFNRHLWIEKTTFKCQISFTFIQISQNRVPNSTRVQSLLRISLKHRYYSSIFFIHLDDSAKR